MRRRAFGWLAVGLVLLLTAATFVVVDARRYFTVSEYTLPDLVGLPYEQATALLRREGLEPVTFVEHVLGLPAEAVSSQAPQAGTVVKRGRSIHLGVNTPPAEARIPDLVGLVQADAVARAVELNLPVGTITFEPSERAAGRVIAQVPAGGERLAPDQRLALTVSSGPARPPRELPDLTGLHVDEAVEQLHALGFRLVERMPSTVSFARPGAVVATIPPAGETVATSTPVIVQYSLSTANVVEVPDVIGYPQWRAQLSLRAAQLQIGQVTYVQDPERPEGVVEVQPTGYTLPGTPVLLTINGPPPSSPFDPAFQGGFGDLPLGQPSAGTPGLTPGGLTPGTTSGGAQGQPSAGGTTTGLPGGQTAADGSRLVPFSFDPTHMGVRKLLEEPYQLRVVVSDERGERVVLDRRVAAGERVTTSVPVYGQEAMLQTYIDDVFFQAWRP